MKLPRKKGRAFISWHFARKVSGSGIFHFYLYFSGRMTYQNMFFHLKNIEILNFPDNFPEENVGRKWHPTLKASSSRVKTLLQPPREKKSNPQKSSVSHCRDSRISGTIFLWHILNPEFWEKILGRVKRKQTSPFSFKNSRDFLTGNC